MTARSIAVCGALLTSLLAACSQNGLGTSGITTGSIDPQLQQAEEAACLTLASQIEGLNADGVPEKVSKAAAKKYKLKSGDIAKADELNKANTEFQSKCSKYPAKPAEMTAEAKPAPAKEKTAAKPPLPEAKAVATALAPESPAASSATSDTTAAAASAPAPTP